MAESAKRDLPINETGLMVVRAARRGPFVQEWSQLLKRPLPPGAELRGLLQGRRRVEVDLLRRRVVLERLSAINTPVGEVIGRLLEVVPSLSDQYDDVELTEPRVVGMPSGDRYLKALTYDERIYAERRHITEALGSYVRPEVEWHDYPIEVNLGFLSRRMQDSQIRVAHSIVGTIFPIEAGLAEAVMLPR